MLITFGFEILKKSLQILNIDVGGHHIYINIFSTELSLLVPLYLLFRQTENSGKIFLLSWTIVTMFLAMAFNCNLRASLVKIDFEDPIGNQCRIEGGGIMVVLPKPEQP